MKPIAILLTCILFACLYSCTNSGIQKLFDEDKLILQQYSIDTGKDTILQTVSGARIDIPAGSIAASTGNTITLEIREAYTVQQMIQARLTTQLNGQPLSSGGMIYINTAAGQKAEIKKAIGIAVPSDYLTSGMQLFKGEKKEEGRINWTNPVALPANKQLLEMEEGKILFQQQCANCHSIGKQMTAPDLAHIKKRMAPYQMEGGNPYYHHFPYKNSAVADTQKKDALNTYTQQYNLYKCNLIRLFNNTRGTLWDEKTDHDIDKIYSYIQNESGRRQLPLPSHHNLLAATDSCLAYKEKILELKNQKEAAEEKKKEMITDNGDLVQEIKNNPPPPGNNPPPSPEKEKVVPVNGEAVYYQFTIETFGWYNIDVLLKEVNGVKESSLFVRITGTYKEKMQLFLIIPSVKVYVEGGVTESKKDEYAFYNKDGTIPLPQGARAWIMAVTETKTSIAFALKEFTTQTSQSFELELKESTKEEFNAVIKQIDNAGISITAADTKNAAAIRETDNKIKDIEKALEEAQLLKPKGCDCDCNPTLPLPVTQVEEFNNK